MKIEVNDGRLMMNGKCVGRLSPDLPLGELRAIEEFLATDRDVDREAMLEEFIDKALETADGSLISTEELREIAKELRS